MGVVAGAPWHVTWKGAPAQAEFHGLERRPKELFSACVGLLGRNRNCRGPVARRNQRHTLRFFLNPAP